MTAKIISNIPRDQRILVISRINDKEVLPKIEKISKNYQMTILNGGISSSKELFSQVKSLFERESRFAYCLSSDDLLLADREKTANLSTQERSPLGMGEWLSSRPNVFILEFANGTRTIILNGGISPKMGRRDDLLNNLEVSFISHFNSKPWHQSYGGKLGYVISNLPTLVQEEPKFHPFSCQMGHTQNVFAQEVLPEGLGQTILLT